MLRRHASTWPVHAAVARARITQNTPRLDNRLEVPATRPLRPLESKVRQAPYVHILLHLVDDPGQDADHFHSVGSILVGAVKRVQVDCWHVLVSRLAVSVPCPACRMRLAAYCSLASVC
eukprot:12583284-Heterocapsa_arctica.AAC.1